MMNRLPTVLIIILLCITISNVFAQSTPFALATINYDTIRITSYNLLNYPNLSSTRDPYFRRVIHSIKPDILVVQEMTSSAGVTTFLNDVLNYYQPGLYSTIAFHDGYDTDNHLFFKPSKVAFINANYISTDLRDIAEYVVKILDTKDTIRLYSVHLKASQGYESDRLAEATILRNYLNNLPAGTKFMVMGDYNIYTSTEPAFQKLIGSEADNDGRCKDPINAVGNWHDNSAFKSIHTQSSRTRTLSDGGSTGGLDDRFDVILTSYSSLDNNIIVSSYTAYGNDGNHFNDSINRLPNYAVPDSVANGLHYSSDHIPVFCNFKFEKSPTAFTLISPSNDTAMQSTSVLLKWHSSINASAYDVYIDHNNPPTTLVSSDQTDTIYNYNNLIGGFNYYWKVIAKNGNNNVAAIGSPWHLYITPSTSLGAFYLLLPTNGAVNQPINGSLVWQSSLNANGYDVYLDTLNPPVVKISSQQIDTFYNYNSLLNNKTYYWKVIAKNNVDSLIAIDSIRSFTTIVAAPSAFLLNSPPDGAIDQPISGTLSWTPSPSATSYDVYMDLNNPPVEKVDSNIAGLSFNYTNLEGGRTFYWKVVAKNIAGEITASNSPRSFTTLNVPSAPSSVGFSDVTQTSIKIYWDDNATNELGYRIYRADSINGTFIQINGDLPENATMFVDTGLSVNHKYYYKIAPFNSSGEGNYAQIALSTLANIPGKPSLTFLTGQSVKIVLDSLNNPPSTEYAIKGSVNGNDLFVQKDGTLQSNIYWQTYNDWGGVNGFVAKNLQPCQIYSFSVKARNWDGVNTQLSDTSMIELVCNSMNFHANGGWNLISIPFLFEDSRKLSLFPTSISSAFAYNGSYVQSDTLKFRKGYWLKFNEPQNINLIGSPVFTDTFDLNPGWNLIGSISIPISVNSIISEPAGNISSSYYYYDGVYQISDTLYPTYGYWVKAKNTGKIMLSSSGMNPKNVPSNSIMDKLSDSYKFIFEDLDGHTRNLYLVESSKNNNFNEINFTLPPIPPEGCFDVRFESNSFVKFIDDEVMQEEISVRVQSASPVILRYNWLVPTYQVQVINENESYDLQTTPQIYIKQGKSNLLIKIKRLNTVSRIGEFNLFQNHPNPFNPSTIISYQVPSKSYIKLIIYNTLGSVVSMLDEGIKDVGMYELTWSPNVAGGAYYVRFEATPIDQSQGIHQFVKKVVFLK